MPVSFRLIFVILIALAVEPVVGQNPPVQPGEPIEYQPFAPERWKEKGQSTRMTPWVGENIVFLTTSPDLDGKVMSVFLDRLDRGWALYAKQIGRGPAPNRMLRGKPIIAAVPNPSFTCGIGCGFIGSTGIEVGGFYGSDYPLVAKQPDTFPHYYFYEMGRNYWLFGEQMHSFATGFAVFMRYVCMDALQCRDTDDTTRTVIEDAESRLKNTNLTFLQAFTLTAGLGEKENRLRDLAPSDQPVMFASAMLRLRSEYGGDEWVGRFFRYLADCPSAGSDNSPDSGQAQGLNWLVAASCAARKDLSPLFSARWRLLIGPKTQTAMRAVDWNAENLSPKTILTSLPADELPLLFATRRPEFITPARRKANLLANASFEEKPGGRWSIASWRQNNKAASSETREVKHGKRSLRIDNPEADDVRYLQKVTVKPNTRYLLSGWVKTNEVLVVESGGRVGANLSILSGPEVTESHIGTRDWTYASLLFDSGPRTAIEICARLGYSYSTTKGTAWFDDLVLIEVEEKAMR